MRKLIKGFLVVVAVILALAAAGMLAVNLYVQSAGTQKRIQQALSSGLKVPVHVSSTIVTPWSGLKASGIAVPQISPAPPGNFLEAASFTARFDWMALFKHRLEAGELSLDDPTPHPLFELWFGTHPTIRFRAAFAQAYDPWAAGQHPKYFSARQ